MTLSGISLFYIANDTGSLGVHLRHVVGESFYCLGLISKKE